MRARHELYEALEELGRSLEPDWIADRPLDLESIEVVMLHDALERALDVRIPAASVTPETFATVAAIEALLEEVAP